MKLSTTISGFLLAKEIAGMSPNTLRNYKLSLRRLQAHLAPADPHIDQITQSQLRSFFQQLLTARIAPGGIAKRPKKPLSPKTIQNIHTCLCSLWTWAITEGYTAEHLPKTIDTPKPEPPVIDPLTHAQIRALLDATTHSRAWRTSLQTQTELPHLQQLRDRAIILTLADTGIRASELTNLNVADVDLHRGTATVRGKGRMSAGQGKQRLIRLGRRARLALHNYLAERDALAEPTAPLFATKTGARIDRRQLRTHLHRLGERAGVPNVYPHRFRHTFAIQYLRNNGNIYALQATLGHTTLDMVKRYLLIAQADIEAAHRTASPVDNWRL